MKCFSMTILTGVVLCFVLSCTSVEPVNRYPNMVADMDPFSMENVEILFDRVFASRLNVSEVEVVFHPRLNAVALEFRHEAINFRQFWDEAARRQFAAALELYKADFAAQNLIDRHNRTRAVYGRTTIRLEWANFNFSGTRVALPGVELGYRFMDGSPFFAVLMRSAREEEPLSGSNTVQSQSITMYFTIAQAEELVKRFDDDLSWIINIGN